MSTSPRTGGSTDVSATAKACECALRGQTIVASTMKAKSSSNHFVRLLTLPSCEERLNDYQYCEPLPGVASTTR